MDFFRQQLVIIQERLRGLSPSQKMLAGTLVIIMAMTMLYWGKFASNRDMVALFPNAIDSAQMTAASAALRAKGISFDDAGGVLRVNAEQQYAAIGAITEAAASPTSAGSNELELMLDKLSPLSTQGEFTARMQAVRNKTIAGMIRSWTGVKSAQIQITDSVRGGLNPTPAGAVINITTNGLVPPRKIANAALAAVLPIVQNLQRSGVTVAVDGNAIVSPNSNGGAYSSNEISEARAALENSLGQEIKNYYNHIQGLKVMVTAELTAETKQEKINSFDAANKVSLPTETLTEKTVTTEPAPITEPGAVPNMSLDANASAATPQAGSKMERTEERNQNYVGTRETVIETPAGAAKVLSATVSVPREHFVKVWMKMNKNAEPDEAQLDALITRELGRMRNDVMVKMQIKDETQVVVNDYVGFEDPALLLANTAVTAGAGGSITLIAGSHGKEVAIGALALTSLFMVGRMVKKSSPPAVAPLLTLDDMPDISSGKKRKVGSLGGIDIAGEVGEGGPIMMGRELDEEVLETAQMVEQVTGFVKDNPDTTAQLLKRWMNRDD